ncbi:1-acyl-sn-glycerol-3-phosphate acyltransferase alpha isoform X1 [Bombyx mandarina]|uniref:1-acyl-sn-glycerol-3-phosphate acyltransferase n=4 Tax=Bombyx TaxID=7090 RepID=A0A8R2M1A9_BOMMO|nr:1-acyl-sn-glycerol-3-phosphate acyltransferase alpha isoform X1 [Bombyx mandarina]XP_037871573.1 1-acyl-sn-glycerol-3-phosphate acyltransferase alpha isoform X1 [Bombyx mori]
MASSYSYPELFLAGFIFILPFLYEKSNVFRYYLKFFLYYAYVLITCTVLLPVVLVYPRDVTNLMYAIDYFHNVASRFCRYASHIVGIEWELRGMEHWNNDECYIVISNHQSSLDILGMFEMWPVMKRCTVVAKRPLMFTGAFGFGAWLSGLVFIDRLKTDRARKLMKEATERVIKQKTKLWIFPEGARYNKGSIQSFKKGAFYLAIDAQIPIMPVVFSQYYFLDSETKTFEPGKVVITTLPPISTKGMTRNDLDALSEMARQQMLDVFHEASKDLVMQIKIAV